ncbi:DNA-binding XRE family transcriptional regulator [Rhizobium sp. SG_E_25_P2]|uniref:helix-turn-helix transcriptional regulator n=1 Tax=Rhizobium sp. SG_E_25_P2 TaxID=2879942 RepID=UPI002476076E|nr:helix-turn-helix domain-containing protein [Rhizobium sp. SG_E_25_P2]MDH6265922.1 DNA-binding XRE family transcriptional regulator [Rhizobium sp. SG_E_25_P2]
MNQEQKSTLLTPALCRGARGMLDWTQADLAERAQVSRSTIRDFEGGRHDLHRATEAQLRQAFEQEGVSLRSDEREMRILLTIRSASEP